MKSNKLFNAITQIALILLASLVIIGVTWQVGQSAGVQQSFERGERGEPNDGTDRPAGRGEHHNHEHGGSEPQLNMRGLAGFSETVFKLGFVMTAIILGQRGWDRWQQSQGAKRAAD